MGDPKGTTTHAASAHSKRMHTSYTRPTGAKELVTPQSSGCVRGYATNEVPPRTWYLALCSCVLHTSSWCEPLFPVVTNTHNNIKSFPPPDFRAWTITPRFMLDAVHHEDSQTGQGLTLYVKVHTRESFLLLPWLAEEPPLRCSGHHYCTPSVVASLDHLHQLLEVWPTSGSHVLGSFGTQSTCCGILGGL